MPEGRSLWGLIHRALIPFMGLHPQNLVSSQDLLLPDTVIPWTRILTFDWGRYKYSVTDNTLQKHLGFSDKGILHYGNKTMLWKEICRKRKHVSVEKRTPIPFLSLNIIAVSLRVLWS